MTDGCRLLNALHRLPDDVPTALVVRHAERYAVADLATADDVLLTPAGEAAARAFGARLPVTRPLQVWHSRIERCGMTARGIVEGFTATGGDAVCAGVLDGLCGAFMLNFDAVVALTRQHHGAGSMSFVRRWFDGYFDPAVIDPCHIAAGKLLDRVAQALTAVPDRLVVLVTHDWEIMTLRETYLGTPHEMVGWVEFLDGLVITREPDAWQFHWEAYVTRHPAT